MPLTSESITGSQRTACNVIKASFGLRHSRPTNKMYISCKSGLDMWVLEVSEASLQNGSSEDSHSGSRSMESDGDAYFKPVNAKTICCDEKGRNRGSISSRLRK